MTVADFTLMLAMGVTQVLPWVGAGVGGALVLFFAFLGIRSALSFFVGLAGDGSLSEADLDRLVYLEAWNTQYHSALEAGFSQPDAFASGEVAGDLALMEKRGEL